MRGTAAPYDIEILPSCALDTDATASWRRGAAAVWLQVRRAQGAAPTEARVARVNAKLCEPRAVLAVAVAGDVVVGMALAEPRRPDQAGVDHGEDLGGHVSMVFVSPEHRRQGVGRALLGAIPRSGGWTSLRLWTRDANADGRAFYAAMGFRRTSEWGLTPAGEAMSRWEWVDGHDTR